MSLVLTDKNLDRYIRILRSLDISTKKRLIQMLNESIPHKSKKKL